MELGILDGTSKDVYRAVAWVTALQRVMFCYNWYMEILVTLLAATILFLLAVLGYVGAHYRQLRRELRRITAEREEEDRLLRLCREQVREREDVDTDEEVEVTALAEYNQHRRAEIEHRKQVILDKLTITERLQSTDVAELLDVSRSTAHGYLSELVEEGHVRQVGDFGPAVHYELPIKASM